MNARVCPHCGDRGFIVPETAMLPSPCDYRDYGTYALGCEGKGFLCRKQIWGESIRSATCRPWESATCPHTSG